MSHPASEAVQGLIPLPPRDFLILFALTDGPQHGYGLLKTIRRMSGGEVRFDPANLYRTMKRMIRRGLIDESDSRPAPDLDDVRRRYFELTGLGMEIVRAEATRLDRLTRSARQKDLVAEDLA